MLFTPRPVCCRGDFSPRLAPTAPRTRLSARPGSAGTVSTPAWGPDPSSRALRRAWNAPDTPSLVIAPPRLPACARPLSARRSCACVPTHPVTRGAAASRRSGAWALRPRPVSPLAPGCGTRQGWAIRSLSAPAPCPPPACSSAACQRHTQATGRGAAGARAPHESPSAGAS